MAGSTNIFRSKEKFYSSKNWKRLADYIRKRDGYICRNCSRYGQRTTAREVHHVYPLESYPEYALCDWNLITLCQGCHGKMHDRNNNELTKLGEDWKKKIKPK